MSFALCCSSLHAQEIIGTPIFSAHSHNDYLKKKPLWGALSNGCTSIEIDVFAHKNDLKVAHVGLALNKRKSFEELYLLPLVAYLEEHAWVYPNAPLVLMIDFKTNGTETLPILLEQIAPYQAYFSKVVQDSIIINPLQLVISGKGFSYESVSSLDEIYVFLDGSVGHCNEHFPQLLVERVSARYGSIFTWKGKGTMPEHERNTLSHLVEVAKNCNTKIRFYAMPEREKIWNTFLDAGVDWINIDDSKHYRKFYKNYKNKKSL